jgi:hypothetical protein
MAACPPVTEENVDRGADPVPGAGRLLAGSIESPELISLLALRLPAASWLEALGPPPCAVLWLPADTAVFLFFLDARTDPNSLRRAGETCREKIAIIKANSSCLSMTPPQELLFTAQQALSN